MIAAAYIGTFANHHVFNMKISTDLSYPLNVQEWFGQLKHIMTTMFSPITFHLVLDNDEKQFETLPHSKKMRI